MCITSLRNHRPLWLIGWVGLTILLNGCTTNAQSTTQRTPQPATMEAACTNLTLDYAFYRDRLDLSVAATEVAKLFTENAVLIINGEAFAGRAAIYDRIANQQNAPLTQHLMSTTRIFADGPDRATGVSYATVYIVPGANSEKDLKSATPPLAAEGFTAIGEYHDEFVRTDNGWRFAKREFKSRIRYERNK